MTWRGAVLVPDEREDAVAGVDEGRDHVAADEAVGAGDEDGGHRCCAPLVAAAIAGATRPLFAPGASADGARAAARRAAGSRGRPRPDLPSPP